LNIEQETTTMNNQVDHTIHEGDVFAHPATPDHQFVVTEYRASKGEVRFVPRGRPWLGTEITQPLWKLQNERHVYIERSGVAVVGDDVPTFKRVLPGKVVDCTAEQNQISYLCDLLIGQVPSPCARDLIFQIRNLAGSGIYTKSGALQNGGRI
jgi:hypothetical protein